MPPPSNSTSQSSRSNQKNSPSKKITLKLKVKDQDLDDGKYRRPTPAASSTRPRSQTRSQSTRRNSTPAAPGKKRGRPRTSKRWQSLNEADLFRSGEEAEQEESSRPKAPTLPDFHPVTTLSFPSLLPNAQDTNAPRLPQPHSRNDPNSAKKCAGCGVSAPSHTHNQPLLRSAETIPSNPPWHLLGMRPVTHVDMDTGSVTELIITRSGPRPNTLAFWYDLTFGEMARKSADLDMKMLCWNLIRWRAQNDDAEAVKDFIGRGGFWMWDGNEERGSGKWTWDDVVVDAVAKGKAWKKWRRLQEKECTKAAGWAVWERRMRSRSRGRFAEDDRGAWLVREPRENGRVRKVLKLGYRRAVAADGRTGYMTDILSCDSSHVGVSGEGMMEFSGEMPPGHRQDDEGDDDTMDIADADNSRSVDVMEVDTD